MRYLVGCVGLLLFALALVPASAQPPAQDALVDKVQKAIDKGINYLKLQEKNRGNWEEDVDAKVLRPGGWTSLALLALLNAGVSPNEAIIKRGLEYLRKVDPAQTYVVGLQTMVFAQTG